MVIGWVAVLAVGVFWAGGSYQADVIEAVPSNLTTLNPLVAGDIVTQDVEAKADGLSAVNVRFGTYEATPTCSLRVTLTEVGGDLVAANERDCASLPDAQLTPALEMDPIETSNGSRYTLAIEVIGGDGAVTLFATPTRPDAPAAQPTALNPGNNAMEVHTEYGRDARILAQIPLLLDRVSDYGPAWSNPLAVITLVGALIALSVGMVFAPWRTAFVMLLLFTVVKGVLWSVIIPPMLGVDEQAHISYAQFMASEAQIPKRNAPANDAPIYSVELETATLFFRQPFVARSDRADYDDDEAGVLDAVRGNRASNGAGAAAGYSPTFYVVPAVVEALAPGTIDARIGAMRLWSVALGAVTVAAVALMGRKLFPQRPSAAILLGVAVALHPMLSQQTAIVNNDALVIAGGAWCLLAAVQLVTPGHGRWWPLIGGLALGATILGKPLGWAFLPVIGLAWLVGRLRGPSTTRVRWDVAGLAGGLVLTYGVWWAVSVLFGYPSAGFQEERSGGGPGIRAFINALTRDWFRQPRLNWVDQYWGNFGWSNTPFPAPVLAILTVAVATGVLLGLWWVVLTIRDMWTAWRGGQLHLRASRWTQPVQTWVCLLGALGSLGLVYVLLFDYFLRTGRLDFVQGRYVLMATPAFLVLPALFLRRIWSRLSPLVPLAIAAGGMAALNVIGLGLVAERYYL